jgi:NAD(P)H-dependent FMN reductase
MSKIAIITSTTRPGRHSHEVAEWVRKFAAQRTDATFEVVDIADYALGNYDEAIPPSFGQYQQDGTKKWADKIAEFDGFIFVTGEYNHSIPGALKNAIDFIYREWNNKAAGIVSYGSAGGVRAAEHLPTFVPTSRCRSSPISRTSSRSSRPTRTIPRSARCSIRSSAGLARSRPIASSWLRSPPLPERSGPVRAGTIIPCRP